MMNRRAPCIRGGIAVLVIAVTLSVVAVAAPAQAQTRSPTPVACTRAAREWTRLVSLNQQAKTLYARAQTLQNRLLRAGRVVVAHRLDQRLAHLRAVHTMLVARVQAIATRIQGRCSGRAPTLTSF